MEFFRDSFSALLGSGVERIVYEGTAFQSQRLSRGTEPEAAWFPKHGFEESFALKRNFLISILAMVPAALMPLAAIGQVASAPESPSAERTEPTYKNQVFAGFGYTSLNQVNQSRYGLEGVNLAYIRDFGQYFGLTADGVAYTRSVAAGNPGDPKVDALLLGPVLHAPLFGKIGGFVHVLLGVEHTGGENQRPNISFAGGMGGGLDYRLTQRFFLRASGDDIASSFTVNNPAPGDSPHERWNSRATIGVVYKF
jgi:hypothetical protein